MPPSSASALIAEIGRRVRSELDLDTVLRVAVEETAKAVGVSRSFIRLGELGEPMPVLAEWNAPGVESGRRRRRPSSRRSNLAARERRTVAVDDVETAEEIDDPDLGSAQALLDLGTQGDARNAHRRVRPGHRRLRPAPGGAEAVAHRGDRARRGGRPRARARHPHGAAPGRERAAAAPPGDADRGRRRSSPATSASSRSSGGSSRRWSRSRAPTPPTAGSSSPIARSSAAGRSSAFPSGTSAARSRPRGRSGARCGPGEHPDPRLRRYRGAAARARLTRSSATSCARRSPGSERHGASSASARASPAGSTKATSRSSRRLPALPRSRSTTRRASRSASARRRCSAASTGSPRCSARPSRWPRRWTRSHRPPATRWAGTPPSCSSFREGSASLAGAHELPRVASRRLCAGGGAGRCGPFVGAGGRRSRSSSRRSSPPTNASTRSLRESLVAEGYGSLLCAPVAGVRDQAYAVVVLFRGSRAFTDEDVLLTQHLSGAARGALERSELFEGERRARTVSQQLARAGASARDEPRSGGGPRGGRARGAGLALRRRRRHPSARERRASSCAPPIGPGTERPRRHVGRLGGGDLRRGRPVAGARRPQGRQRAATARPRRSPARAGSGGVRRRTARRARRWPQRRARRLLAVRRGPGATTRCRRSRLLPPPPRLRLRTPSSISASPKRRSGAERSSPTSPTASSPSSRDDRIVLWNSMAEQITGVPASEALGRLVPEVLQRELSTGGAEGAGRAPAWQSAVAGMRCGSRSARRSCSTPRGRSRAGSSPFGTSRASASSSR